MRLIKTQVPSLRPAARAWSPATTMTAAIFHPRAPVRPVRRNQISMWTQHPTKRRPRILAWRKKTPLRHQTRPQIIYICCAHSTMAPLRVSCHIITRSSLPLPCLLLPPPLSASVYIHIISIHRMHHIISINISIMRCISSNSNSNNNISSNNNSSMRCHWQWCNNKSKLHSHNNVRPSMCCYASFPIAAAATSNSCWRAIAVTYCKPWRLCSPVKTWRRHSLQRL